MTIFSKNRKILTIAIICSIASFTLAGCTSDKEPIYIGNIEAQDPYENYNRGVFAFNAVVDDAIIHPVAKGYNAVVPKPARTGVTNVLKTLRAPVNLANQLLQGDLDGSGRVIKRTIINVMLSGGLVDFAGHEGIEYEMEDFGQTMAVWGIDHGPFIVVPILGPSSLRDYTGYAVDSFADPLRWYLNNIDRQGLYYTKIGMEYLDLRASLVDVLEELEQSSIDYYAATRSIYYQRRQALIEDRNSSTPDFEDDDF